MLFTHFFSSSPASPLVVANLIVNMDSGKKELWRERRDLFSFLQASQRSWENAHCDCSGEKRSCSHSINIWMKEEKKSLENVLLQLRRRSSFYAAIKRYCHSPPFWAPVNIARFYIIPPFFSLNWIDLNKLGRYATYFGLSHTSHEMGWSRF